MTGGPRPLGVQAVAYAGLDALLAALPLDLCAYLHIGEQLGPQLYLRRPTLTDLDPADAFNLFSELRDQLDDTTAGERRVVIHGFDAVVTVTTDAHSRGLWVVGRRDQAIAESDAVIAAELGRAIMTVCHAAEATALDRTPPPIVRVTIESTNGDIRAEVAVGEAGAERVGHGEASAALSAVASATLNAVDPSWKLVTADEDGIGDARVVLVLVRDARGHTSVGAALVAGDPLRAAAAAAMVATAGTEAG